MTDRYYGAGSWERAATDTKRKSVRVSFVILMIMNTYGLFFNRQLVTVNVSQLSTPDGRNICLRFLSHLFSVTETFPVTST